MIDNIENLEKTATLPEKLVPKNNESFDVVIIGAGPAGLSAALCAARADLKVLVLEKALPGGECSTACEINNYIGFPGGILGDQLGKKMEDQVNTYGIYYSCEEVTDILDIKSASKRIQTNLDNVYVTKSVILALGLEPKPLNAGFESKFLGRGVSYYARCDVDYYTGKDVAVIGGGNCACYAAEYLAKFVNKVYMIHQHDHIRAVKKLKNRIEQNPKIDIMWDSQVTEAFGIDKVEKIKVTHIINQQYTWLDVKGIFVYVGRKPPKEIVSLDVEVDEGGYIITDEFMRTNIEGIYAAGDIRNKQVRQIATAVSDGMIAAINVERDLFR